MNTNKRPIILIHGLWNSSAIFSSLLKRLDYYGVEYYAPTLNLYFGRISIVELAKSLDELIIKKYGKKREIDILGFSMGGIIARYWINYCNGYLKTKNIYKYWFSSSWDTYRTTSAKKLF